jgi:hypothetical protein
MVFSSETALEDFHRKVKELWNIPRKQYYLKINGIHEDIPIKAWPGNVLVKVEIKGLLGGGRKGALSISFEGEECRCWTNQTFREVAEDRGLIIRSNMLWATGDKSSAAVEIDDTIGDYFDRGSTVFLKWDSEEELGYENWDDDDHKEEEENDEEEEADDVSDISDEVDRSRAYRKSIYLDYSLEGVEERLVISRKHTMRSFMAEVWNEIEWKDFVHQGKHLDPESPSD